MVRYTERWQDHANIDQLKELKGAINDPCLMFIIELLSLVEKEELSC